VATTEIWTFKGDLRTDADLTGFEVEAKDGSIGSVDEATNELGASYVVVDTGPWIFGKRVLLPAGVIERIDRDRERVVVNRTRDEIKDAPEYDPELGVTTVYRQQLSSYYGRAPDERRARPSRPAVRTSTSRSRSSSPAKRASGKRSRAQTKSSSSGGRRRGGQRRSRTSEGPTKEELYAQAKRLGIEGRSKMNKTELARAVGRKRGASASRSTSRSGRARSGGSRQRTTSSRARAKATPIEVQAFLDGVSYPTRKGDLVREAERSGAQREVRTTLERLPEERFESPTEVSEAIGKLR
jgi:hypothetical protein